MCKTVPAACLWPQDLPTFAYIYHVQCQPPHESLHLYTEKRHLKSSANIQQLFIQSIEHVQQLVGYHRAQ